MGEHLPQQCSVRVRMCGGRAPATASRAAPAPRAPPPSATGSCAPAIKPTRGQLRSLTCIMGFKRVLKTQQGFQFGSLNPSGVSRGSLRFNRGWHALSRSVRALARNLCPAGPLAHGGTLLASSCKRRESAHTVCSTAKEKVANRDFS